MSNPSLDAARAQAAKQKILSAYDEPGTHDEISRRTFMANATLTMSGIIGLGLAIPIVGSILPRGGEGTGTWSPLSPAEWKSLQRSTQKPVKLSFTLKSKDGYLPAQVTDQFVWGVKTSLDKMRKARPDLFTRAGKSALPYDVVNLGFVIFSPICPHLGCRYDWNDSANRFLCPCHGSQYSYEGAHLAGPAPRGLDPLPLREHSGVAEVTWIRYEQSTPARIIISYTS